MNEATQSDKNDDVGGKKVGGQSEIQSVKPSAINEKGNILIF